MYRSKMMVSKAGNQTKIFIFDGQMEYVGNINEVNRV